jgi:hypothetical protein
MECARLAAAFLLCHRTQMFRCMKTQPVTVIDGPLPPGFSERPDMEPQLVTAPEDMAVRDELMQREPLFHRPAFGTTRKDFEKMTAPEFWEVGASGRRYSREFGLSVLEDRYKEAYETVWEIGDFHCRKIAPDNYLATYTLIQGPRVTRRSTIWRRTANGWQVVFHQGTIVT